MLVPFVISLCCSCSTGSSKSTEDPDPAPESAASAAQQPSAQPVDMPKIDANAMPQSIGSAKCAEDGTITLMLRAEDGKGAVGDAMLVYPPSHEKYEKIVEHLGGIKPGESKPVPPWKN